MNAKTLKALKGSIAKWEAIVAGTERDDGPDNCPLCQLFNKHPFGECDGCPVAESVGLSGCDGTPYQAWDELGCDRAETPNAVAAARAELRFLKSLLPRKRK